MAKDRLYQNEELRKGEYLLSANGEFKAIFQEDANFVIYAGEQVKWASHTHGMDPTSLRMQTDGNLVMYNDSDQPRWNTRTQYGHGEDLYLQLTNEGKLVLMTDGCELWCSDKNCGKM